jgi:hypothetical protein
MQLRLVFVGEGSLINRGMTHVMVSSEKDIRAAGFDVARSLRSWLRNMPFVPSTSDLHFHVYAEVVGEPVSKVNEVATVTVDAPKRKRKKVK